ncbi:hypothetical protein VTI74DRAFT_7278 [Chaetomium olivicolor]
MFSIMPQTPAPPTFSARSQQGPNCARNHRPAFSSPLSSSPIRASSASPPPAAQPEHFTSQPLSPCDPNSRIAFLGATQSSPIFGSGPSIFGSSSDCQHGNNNNNTKFRFASRAYRPNPVLRRREDAQEGRRRLFFQNVRRRQEEKRWEMRGGEDELLKLEFWRLSRERQQAWEAEAEQYLGGMDADLVALEEEELRMQAQWGVADMDAMMADAIAQQEAAEVDALISGLDAVPGAGSPHFSDDDDYDGIFMELVQQEGGQGMGFSQDVEMS